MTSQEHLVNESYDLVKDLVKDAISKQAVLSKIKEVCFSKEWLQFRVDNGSDGQRDLIIKFIEDLPSVQPKIGHWILTDDDFVYCSECEDSYYPRPIDAGWYYCPHCGCRMKGEGEE